MRIEFYTDRESPAELRLIIQICEAGIAAHARREAEWKEKAAAERNNPEYGSAIDGFSKFGETRNIAGQAAQLHNLPKIHENLVSTQAAQVAQIGTVDEATGETFVNRDVNAAAAAFGGGAAALDSIGNPTIRAGGVSLPSVPSGSSASVQGETAPPSGAPSVTPNTIDRDAKGVPWDERIHSEAKTRNNDGTWRFKRKLDDAVKAAVLAEIGTGNGVASTGANVVPGSSGVPPLPPPPPPPPAPVTLPAVGTSPVPLPPPSNVRMPDAPVSNVVQLPVNPTSAQPAPRVPSPSATAATTAPVGASPTNGAMGYRTLIIKLNKAIAGGTVTQESLILACRELGIGDSPAALGAPQNAHLVQPLHDRLFPNG